MAGDGEERMDQYHEVRSAGGPRSLGLQESELRCERHMEVTEIKGLVNIRIIFMVAVAALIALACTASPAASPSLPAGDAMPTKARATPEPTPSPTATPIPTATPVTFEEPSEPAFEDTLEGEDIAKFRGLPSEFQDALNHVAETPQHPQTSFTSHEEALEFLRGLPDDVQPVSEVLPPETLDMFNELGDDDRSFVLLDMYARTFSEKEFYADSPETERQALLEGLFEQLVKQVYEMEFGDGEVHLPPIAEALSADALRKLDEIDPLTRRAFLLRWRNLRVLEDERDDLAAKLERALLAAPLELPPLEELGLSQEALKALEDVPNLRTFVDEFVAADLASTGGWDTVGTEYSGAMLLENIIERASTPEGSRMFAQGLLPVTNSQPPPLISHFWPGSGFWPLWAIPPFFRDMQPEDVVTEWPDHEQVLSQEALAKLDSLDAPLQEAFEKYWYGTGALPNDAHWMAGIVVRWERDLRALPFDTVPEIEDLLSGGDLAAYRQLDEFMRKIIIDDIALDFLHGQTWPTSSTTVNTYQATPEEFIEALKTSVARAVQEASKHVSRGSGS